MGRPVAGPASVDGVAGLLAGDGAGLAGTGHGATLAAVEGSSGADDGFLGFGVVLFHVVMI